MRVLVTGATGFIGQHLCRALVRRGHRVTAMVRRSSSRAALQREGVGFAIGDVATGEGLDGAVIEADWIFHLAGLTRAWSAEAFMEVNALGTGRLLAAIERRGWAPKLVFCSSLSAMGPNRPGHPHRETDTPSPISAYGRSKLQAETLLRRKGADMPTVIVRPSIVYGPADNQMLPSLVPMLKAGVLLKSGFGRKEYSLVHVCDLCDALIAAAERGRTLCEDDPAQGVYFVSDGGEYEWGEVCRAMAKAWGKPDMPVLSLPEWAGYPAVALVQLKRLLRGGNPSLTLDKVREMSAAAWTCVPERAALELGYRPAFALEQGMQDAVQWYQANGMAPPSTTAA